MGSRHRGPKEEVRALNAFIALSRAADSVESRTHAVMAEEGLTESQFGVLEALHHLGPLCAAELAKKVLRSKGNLTLVIANLERDGLARRTTREEDRRYRTVELTRKGRTLMEKTFPRHARLVAKTMGALEPGEQDELRRLCRKLGKAAAG
ncbi:MAG TPA: MarR family winged helix-turn-helix transcriptional regulator [Elusimicrobiota bacterium]|nr:MarR family winged helix-turn-helix transcriptional regulator [Elusimicrobiota bacterium]